MRRLDRIREALQKLPVTPLSSCGPSAHPHISRTALMELTDCMQYIMFPECSSLPNKLVPSYIEPNAVMEWALSHLADIMVSQINFAFILHGDEACVQMVDVFRPVESPQRAPPSSEAIVTKLLVDCLPRIRWLLHTDVEVIFKNDVAATSTSEVVLCYPGVRCMLHQRLAHQLYLLGAPPNFTRMLTEIAHSLTGIDIHPQTSIGHHFFIDHGTGIVIGATAQIGNYVSIYQGVTLGARSFPVDKTTGEKIKHLPRHPIIQDNVTIYANAVVLGRVTIGRGSTIGGNCWVVRNVAPNTAVVQRGSRVLQPNENMFLENNGSGI